MFFMYQVLYNSILFFYPEEDTFYIQYFLKMAMYFVKNQWEKLMQ